MSVRRVPVPRRLAIGEGASGAAALFDGNYSDDIVSWMFSNENWNDDDIPAMLDQLMQHTVWGHLGWVVFPKQGYRL